MSAIRETILGPVGTLVGLAIGIAIIVIVAGLTVMSTASAGLTSAVDQIVQFLGIIGLGIAVGLLIKVFA